MAVNANKYYKEKAYDGSPLQPGEVLVPFWIKREFKEEFASIIDDNLTTFHIGGFRFLIGFAPIAEGSFESYMKLFWKEINTYLAGTRARTGSPASCLSLDEFLDDYSFEIEDFNTPSPEEYYLANCEESPSEDQLLGELLERLQAIKPRYAQIVEMLLDKFPVEKIFVELGLKPSRGYQEIANAFCLAKAILNNKQ